MKPLRAIALAAAAAFALSSTPSQAQDRDWSGFYIGALKGFSVAWDTECGFDCRETAFNVSKVVGYNWDTGDVIYGIDKMVIYTPLFGEEDVFKLSIQAMGRIGVEVGDNAMVYGAAGIGWSKLFCGECTSDLHSAYGAVAAGLEYQVKDDLIWRTHAQLSKPFHPELDWLIVGSIGTGVVWLRN